MDRPSVTFVVMAGGRGERLWPLVRADRPKVCVSPEGRDSLLGATLARLRGVWPGADWLIVTTREQAGPVRRAVLPSLRRAVLVEPMIRNTAACLTLSAALVARRDPQRILVVVPADHWVGGGARNAAAYRRSLRAAIQASAREQTIAVIGLKPTHPHPGFGYVRAGARVKGAGAARVFRVARFIEKPTRTTAARLLRQGRTYWNAGMFVGPARVFLELTARQLPEHVNRLVPLARQAGRPGWLGRAARAYQRLPSISFDHGVMVPSRTGLVVEGPFQWADLGSWDSWSRLRGRAPVVSVDSRRVTVVSDPGHLVAAIGLRDVIVVRTERATLVCRADRAQAVRDALRQIRQDPRLAAFE